MGGFIGIDTNSRYFFDSVIANCKLHLISLLHYTYNMIALRRAILSPKISRSLTSTTKMSSTTRLLSASILHDDDNHDHEEWTHHQHNRMPVTKFTEDEEMVRDAARTWANQELKPIVRDMDDECKTRPEVIRGLFDHGFMGMVSFV